MFAAVIARGTRSAPEELVAGDTLLAALFPFARPDLAGVWHDGRALIAQGLFHNTPESRRERAPEICAETGRVIASWVRLDNREELCARLRLSGHGDLTDPQIILAAHRQWGEACASRLEGDFSFVIHDPTSGKTYCARDSMGAKPLYYLLNKEILVAATSVAAIRTIKGLRLTPSLQWAALFAAGMTFAHDQGAYDEVRKLPPAHEMTLGRESSPGPREYFAFDLSAPHTTRRDERWVEQYREPWPITLVDLAGDTADIVIPPGVGLLFRGNLMQHWREPLTGPWHKQIFLHYVRKDGPYSDYAFDRRKGESVAPTT